jgi:hypothetical protein
MRQRCSQVSQPRFDLWEWAPQCWYKFLPNLLFPFTGNRAGWDRICFNLMSYPAKVLGSSFFSFFLPFFKFWEGKNFFSFRGTNVGCFSYKLYRLFQTQHSFSVKIFTLGFRLFFILMPINYYSASQCIIVLAWHLFPWLSPFLVGCNKIIIFERNKPVHRKTGTSSSERCKSESLCIFLNIDDTSIESVPCTRAKSLLDHTLTPHTLKFLVSYLRLYP